MQLSSVPATAMLTTLVALGVLLCNAVLAAGRFSPCFQLLLPSFFPGGGVCVCNPSKPTVRCFPEPCDPLLLQNGTVDPACNGTINQTCLYTGCDVGFQLSEQGDIARTCQPDGTYNGTAKVCQGEQHNQLFQRRFPLPNPLTLHGSAPSRFRFRCVQHNAVLDSGQLH
jgi:hypothetical protein